MVYSRCKETTTRAKEECSDATMYTVQPNIHFEGSAVKKIVSTRILPTLAV